MNAENWSNKTVADLLRWYAAMGVDVAVNEDAADRFAETVPAKAVQPLVQQASIEPVAVQPVRQAGPVLAAAPVEETARLATVAASAAQTLDELRDALGRFEGCNLRHTATNLVFADGTPGARVMFVGEAPGRDEDLQGVPFVGRAGQLLDRMLTAIGLSRETAYIANVVPWRPPGNRTPTPQETAACRPFVVRQIELANPDFLVCLGNSSMRELFGTTEGILKLRGRWRDYQNGGRSIRAMGMLHPAYLLRQPLHKRLAWRDLRTLKAALDEPR